MIPQSKEEKAIKRNNHKDISLDITFMFDLKRFRLSVAKLSQEEFARKLGVATGTIGKIEAGHQRVSDKMLERIENAFKVDLNNEKSYNLKPESTPDEDTNVWRDKYYALLEKYNACLEDKEQLRKQHSEKSKITDKPIHKL